MSTESISDRVEHIRSIGVTAVSALAGVGAALASAAVTADAEAEVAAGDQLALYIVLGAILIQYAVIQVAGIYGDDEFGVKHYLFIAFMTFAMWFVTWGIMLTSEAAV